jgi:endopeptidase Clp ATP-binding regulatory subunit ClpX
MSDTKKSLPSQKELEKELSDYLSRKYGEQVKIISTGLFPQAKSEGSPEVGKVEAEKKEPFHFNLAPEELVAFLDEYVVRQDEAKAVLATKICTHFNKIRYMLERNGLGKTSVGQVKSNVLLIGPTGVGKTYLIKLIAQRLGVPFVKGDATKFSETGYVGGDVEDLVRDLVRQADGDIDRAQYGIIYVDEIDKIAASQNRLGLDVSRTGVQRALLKPMEETEVELKVPHDPISQIEAMEHYRTTGKREKKVVNTRNILFIMSGAFDGLEAIIKKRTQRQGMGFEGDISSKNEAVKLLKLVKAEDLIEFGFESEFVGRLPVLAILDTLDVDDLYAILMNPNSAVVVGKKQDFQAYGISLLFEDEACREIAMLAVKEKTGARGLVSVIEKVLLPFEKKMPSTDIRHLVVSVDMVRNPASELAKFLASPASRERIVQRYQELASREQERLVDFISRTLGGYLEKHGVMPTPARLTMMAAQCQQEGADPLDVCDFFIALIAEINKCAQYMAGKCDIAVEFSEEAVDYLLARKPRSMETLHTICETLYKTFEYGLRLLSQRKENEKVVVTLEGVERPAAFINDYVESVFKL